VTAPSGIGAARRRRAKRATDLLERRYGSPRHGNKDDPLDELVYIILSQMTTGPSYGRVYRRLREACPVWEDAAKMPLPRLKALIKDAGLSHQKAPRLKAILERIQQDFGRMSLEGLAEMTDVEAESYLTSLPGVGTKTAKCVLMYSLGRQVLPIDTHVFRVGVRLGLLDEQTPATRAHSALEAVVSPQDRYSFHVNALAHGRQTCLARFPRCDVCPTRRLCVNRPS
jgi:endonuclease III